MSQHFMYKQGLCLHVYGVTGGCDVYELRNVPKVLCTNEDYIQVHTDFEKLMT